MKKFLALAIAVLPFLFAAQTVPNYVPTNGLVGWWPFNGNANDESGNGNNGTVNGATLTSDRNGNLNSAYAFDGVDDGIITPDSGFSYGSSDRSINLWVKDESVGSYCSIMVRYGSHAPSQGCWILHNNNCNPTQPFGNLRADFFNSGVWSGNNSMSNSNWNMVSISMQNSNCMIYLNGTLIAQGNVIATTTPANNSFYIGGDIVNVPNYFFKGDLDDIGIWNRALTQQEITDLYNAVNCANNLVITPSNNTLPIGSSASFTATTSDPNPSFIWQSDFGQGFQTLNNYGAYTGANTSSLSISNLQLSNHQQPVRAISTSGNCVDTSNVATITIADTCITIINDTTFITITDTLIINAVITGLTPPNNQNTIKVFPNPANDHITLHYGNFASMSGYQLKITNSLGQQVFITNIIQQSDYIDLSTWTGNGVYFVHLIDPQGITVDIRKIVLQ
jgi:Concanavalin A-like lectin/glucanases superfamily/Secretion system C-terminal sorting domain